MATKRLVAANPQRITTGLLLPATHRDSYIDGDKWLGVGDLSAWQYGREVQAFNQFGQTQIAVGDEIEIIDLYNRPGVRVRVERIRLIQCQQISDADIAMMGYVDRAEWLDQTEGGLGGRAAWLLTLHVLERFDQDAASARQVAQKTTIDADGKRQNTTVDLRGSDKLH